jgi:hypothetical protein
LMARTIWKMQGKSISSIYGNDKETFCLCKQYHAQAQIQQKIVIFP